MWIFFLCQVEDGIRDLVRSRGLGDVYKRQLLVQLERRGDQLVAAQRRSALDVARMRDEAHVRIGVDVLHQRRELVERISAVRSLSLIHI